MFKGIQHQEMFHAPFSKPFVGEMGLAWIIQLKMTIMSLHQSLENPAVRVIYWYLSTNILELVMGTGRARSRYLTLLDAGVYIEAFLSSET